MLLVLVVVLIALFAFSVYDGSEDTESYIAEELIEPEDVTEEEAQQIPVMEESEEEVAVMGEVEISIYNGKFYPDRITISPGTTVTWINEGRFPHKVVAYDRLFYGDRIAPGERYSFTFTNSGSHRYFDAVFPKAGKGKVIVQEEPLPITGGVIGVNLSGEESAGKFALLVLLFVIMVLGLSHGIYKHHNI